MWSYFLVYLGIGGAVFFLIRTLFRRTALDEKPHEKIWFFPLWSIEGWVLGPLLWPALAALSLCWFAADMLHRQGRKEMTKAAEAEARRDKRHDNLDLYQKIDLLKAGLEKASERSPGNRRSF